MGDTEVADLALQGLSARWEGALLEGTGDAEAVYLAIQAVRVPEGKAGESPDVRRSAIVTVGGAVPCKMLQNSGVAVSGSS